MFCHECGSQLSEEMVFCPNCGTKVAKEEPDLGPSPAPSPDTGGEEAAEGLDVTLVNAGNHKVRVIRRIQEKTGLGLKEAKDLADNTPSVIKKGVSMEEAERIKSLFVHEGARVEVTDQKGNAVNVIVHCESCGAEIEDGSTVCSVCGKAFEIPPVQPQKNVQSSFEMPHGDIDRKEAFEEWKKEWKEIFGKIWSEFKRISDIWKVLILLGVILILVFGLLVVFALLRLIFSSVIIFLIAVAGGYIAYQRWGAVNVTEFVYDTRSNILQLPEGMNAQTLLEALGGKFNYPYFKGVRYGEKGECVIEGRYSEYTVLFNSDNIAYLPCNPKYDDKRYRTILLEAIAVRSYINKFFNPTCPIDVIKDFKALKFAEGQRKAVSVVLAAAGVLVCLAIGIEYALPGGLQRLTKPGMEVRSAYLPQYSETVTIEDAFEDFFDNGKWSKYKENGYSYVVFTGACEYAGQRADVRITFKITGENFIVDSLDLNGQQQNDLILYALLSSVFEED